MPVRHSSFRKSGTLVQSRLAPAEREGNAPVREAHRFTVERRIAAEAALPALDDYIRPPGPASGPLGFVGALRLVTPATSPSARPADSVEPIARPRTPREVRRDRAPRREPRQSLAEMIAAAPAADRPAADVATLQREIEEDRRAWRELYGHHFAVPDVVE